MHKPEPVIYIGFAPALHLLRGSVSLLDKKNSERKDAEK
jgi:hypothetical protein